MRSQRSGSASAKTTTRWAATSFLLLIGGCSSFHEVHYIKSDAQQDQTPNYFRITVDGWTALSSSRYVSGYFDEDAVNTYFGGFKQPKNGEGVVPVAKADSDGVKPAAGGDGGKALILLLSSNSDAIADSLTALEQSDAITSSLEHVFNRATYQSANKSDANVANAVSAGKALQTLGDKLIGTADAGKNPIDTATAADANNDLLIYANALGASLSPAVHFDSLKDAKTWITNFRPQDTQGGDK